MCAQLDSQVVSKRLPRKETPSNFHEFWSEELYYEKKQRRK
jgi:cephalosporin-C deacetylase-like acetyl esterase